MTFSTVVARAFFVLGTRQVAGTSRVAVAGMAKWKGKVAMVALVAVFSCETWATLTGATNQVARRTWAVR